MPTTLTLSSTDPFFEQPIPQLAVPVPEPVLGTGHRRLTGVVAVVGF